MEKFTGELGWPKQANFSHILKFLLFSGLKVAGILIILMLLESTQLKVQAVRTNGCFQGSEAASDWFKDFRVRYSVILHFTDALVYTNLFFYFNNLT